MTGKQLLGVLIALCGITLIIFGTIWMQQHHTLEAKNFMDKVKDFFIRLGHVFTNTEPHKKAEHRIAGIWSLSIGIVLTLFGSWMSLIYRKVRK